MPEYAPDTVIECQKPGPHGRPIVAVIGYCGDWAAYEQSYPDQITTDLIARQGDKVLEEQARPLFPQLAKLRYRH